MNNTPILQMKGVAKRFTLHHQNGIELPVLGDVDLAVCPGECVVLDGPSGMGKSTLLKMVYANYRATEGSITVRSTSGALVDVTQATPRALVQLRRDTIGYVSQFLRVIPRVSALDVVAEPSDGTWPAELSQALTLGPVTRLEFKREDGSYVDVELSRQRWQALRDSLQLAPGRRVHLRPRQVTRFVSTGLLQVADDPAAAI